VPRRARLFFALPLALGLACGSSGSGGPDDDDRPGGSGRGGSGGTNAATDRCAECTTASDCSTNFCNQVASNDLADLVGVSLDPQGYCSEPGDTGTCYCITGYISGNQLCIGTGCTGTPVRLCDHLSGSAFTGSSSGGAPAVGGSAPFPPAGGTGGAGGTFPGGGIGGMPLPPTGGFDGGPMPPGGAPGGGMGPVGGGPGGMSMGGFMATGGVGGSPTAGRGGFDQGGTGATGGGSGTTGDGGADEGGEGGGA
jgi:hypothetical protein